MRVSRSRVHIDALKFVVRKKEQIDTCKIWTEGYYQHKRKRKNTEKKQLPMVYFEPCTKASSTALMALSPTVDMR
jgi:hypothetical protein